MSPNCGVASVTGVKALKLDGLLKDLFRNICMYPYVQADQRKCTRKSGT